LELNLYLLSSPIRIKFWFHESPIRMLQKNLFFLFVLWLASPSYAQDFTESNLPIVQVFTNGLPIPDEPKVKASMGIIYNGPDQVNLLSEPFNEYDGFIGIEIRGSTSQALYDKKSYALETQDDLGENRNVSLLNMPKENDWVLHGPYGDKSLIRNALVYNVAGQIMDYAPRSVFVELLIDASYEGVYLLTEKIKRDKNRVAISSLKASDKAGDPLSGGYILKLDKETGFEADGFLSAYDPLPGSFQQTYFQYHYPKPRDIIPEQEAYIQEFIADFEDLMVSDSYADSLEGYSQYIDRTSFVDYFIVNELFKNVDAYRLSTYMYKDRNSIDGRLKLGPVWDFNIALGNVEFCEGAKPEGWVKGYNEICPDNKWLVPFWWERFWKDQNFRIAIKSRWEELRGGVLKKETLMTCIDSLNTQLEEAQERNFQRWPVLSTYVWPNWFVGDTHQEEMDYLKQWLEDRLLWIDGEMQEIDQPFYNINDYFVPKVFPNPFYESFSCEYYIRATETFRLQLFDAQGKLVADHLKNNLPNGTNTFHFSGQNLAAGIYFYQVRINGEIKNLGKIVKGF